MQISNKKSASVNRSINLSLKDYWIFLLLVISAILFYIILIIYYYLPNYSIVANIYLRYPFTTFLTIIIFIRLLVSIYGSIFLFKKWFSKKIRSYSDLPFVLGIFFFLFILAKLMDLVIFTTYRMYTFYNYSYIFLLNIIKLRYIILVVNILPLFLTGMYLYLFRLNLKKPAIEQEKISKIWTLIFSLFYFPILLTIIVLINDIQIFSYMGAIISLSSLSFMTWMFFTIHKGKILPEINSLIVGLGFLCYTISNAILPLLVYIIGPSSLEGERLSALILEFGTLISILIILLGFKKRTHYKIQ